MLLLDNSAWSHLNSARLPEDRRKEVLGWMSRSEIVVCLPFLLEAGYSARSAADHGTMMDGFHSYQSIRITAAAERRTQRVQRELAAVGHHRLAPIDVIVAACAHEAGAGVLHYDGDYDILATRTSLRFHSEWLAPAGTL